MDSDPPVSVLQNHGTFCLAVVVAAALLNSSGVSASAETDTGSE